MSVYTCEKCGGDVVKQDGYLICKHCLKVYISDGDA